MDVYILPKHIWEKYDAKAITKYDGAGRRRLAARSRSTRSKKGQFCAHEGEPELLGRQAGDRRGRLPHLHQRRRDGGGAEEGRDRRGARRPDRRRSSSSRRPTDIVAVAGPAGRLQRARHQRRRRRSKKPHPALLDPKVRQAIAHAIDKQTLVDRVLDGLGDAGDDDEPVRQPGLDPGDPRGRAVRLRPRRRRTQILDEAGLQGHERRRHPRDARRRATAEVPLRGALRVADRGADTPSSSPAGCKQIGIATTQQVLQRQPAHRDHRQGRLRHVRVGLDAVRRPRPDAVVLHVRPGQRRTPRTRRTTTTTPTGATRSYDALYKQQNVELDQAKRVDLVHQMLTRFYDVGRLRRRSTTTPTCRPTARTASRAGCASRRRSGPVLFSNTSPTYAKLKPVAASTDGGGGGISTASDRRDRRRGLARARRRRLLPDAPDGPRTSASSGRRDDIAIEVSARFVTRKVLGSLATLAVRHRLQLLPLPGRRDATRSPTSSAAAT